MEYRTIYLFGSANQKVADIAGKLELSKIWNFALEPGKHKFFLDNKDHRKDASSLNIMKINNSEWWSCRVSDLGNLIIEYTKDFYWYKCIAHSNYINAVESAFYDMEIKYDSD